MGCARVGVCVFGGGGGYSMGARRCAKTGCGGGSNTQSREEREEGDWGNETGKTDVVIHLRVPPPPHSYTDANSPPPVSHNSLPTLHLPPASPVTPALSPVYLLFSSSPLHLLIPTPLTPSPPKGPDHIHREKPGQPDPGHPEPSPTTAGHVRQAQGHSKGAPELPQAHVALRRSCDDRDRASVL